ncbi:MAG: alpha/beta fold hydrolase [Pseudomonadota bacterium]
MTPREVEIHFQGRKLAGKRWGQAGKTPIIALHGWLDNANSFDFIAPALSDFDIFALDFAGHGNSDHRPLHTPYLATLDIQDIIAVANHLQWEQFSLLAHSMGAEISANLIGMFPDRVQRLFAIDGYAESISNEKWLQLHRDSIDKNLTKQAGALRVFPNREEMAQSVAKATGQTVASARILIERGSKKVDGGFSWSSDPRVRWSDALGITYEQMDHNIAAFNGEILVVGANDGLQWYRADLERLTGKFEHFTFIAIEGSHHVHMDADTTELVQLIQGFFGSQVG